MLASFRIQNYKSVLDETISLDFREGKAPNGYKTMPLKPFLTDSCGNKRVPVLVLLGANASGKSNLLEATKCFRRLLRQGIKDNFFPNKLNDKFNTTLFEIKFSCDKDMFSYLLEYNAERILKEQLKREKEFLVKVEEGTLKYFEFTQKGYELDDMARVLNVECIENGKQIKALVPQIRRKYPGLSATFSKLADALFKCSMNVLENDLPPTIGLDLLPKEANKQQFITRLAHLIKQFDIDINGFTVQKSITNLNPETDIEEINKLRPSCTFRIKSPEGIKHELAFIRAKVKNLKGEAIEFDFIRELSKGTQRLFGLLGLILTILDRGDVLFIDELDETLHPFIVQKILEMFKDPDYNVTGRAQLVCTVQNPLAMNGLRVSEIAFVQKTIKDGTKILPLADFEGIRNVTDFVKQYMEGRFSAVPSPYL